MLNQNHEVNKAQLDSNQVSRFVMYLAFFTFQKVSKSIGPSESISLTLFNFSSIIFVTFSQHLYKCPKLQTSNCKDSHVASSNLCAPICCNYYCEPLVISSLLQWVCTANSVLQYFSNRTAISIIRVVPPKFHLCKDAILGQSCTSTCQQNYTLCPQKV